MNNKRKASVLFLIAFLSFGMAFAPMAYVGFQNAEPAGLAPSDSETQELMESISRRLDNFMDRKDKLDPTLRTFVVTGELDNDVVTTSAGDISVMLYLDQATPMRSVHDVTNVKWTMDLGMFKIVFASVSGAQNIRKLDAMKDVMYVEADMRVETAPIQPIEAPEAFEFGEVVGADAAKALGYDGSGVTIGIVDGAVDFSIPDLQDALYYDGLGRPTSWDPSGVGMVPMVLANSTPLTGNITAYLEAGNVLTYESGGKRYINVTGFDPGVNDRGTAYNLIARFVTAYQGFWGINNGTEFVENVMWQDLEIPLTSSENYTVGWVFQQRWESYAKLFAPALIVDGSDLIIDWNGTNAWTNMWMDAYWFEDLDLNVTSNRTYISDMMDWSFVDDQTGGYVFSATGSNAVLAADLDDDGTDDLGIGSLTWSVDGDGDLYCGITDDALMMNIMYPEDNGDTHGSDNHGVWTTAAAASRGVTGHDVYENGTLYNLPGIANGSKIIASTYFTSGDRLNSQFWAAGYHIQADGNFTYNAEGEMHRADLISNSWGVTLTSAADLSIYTIVWDIISTPGLMKPNYPGTLFLFSAGNDGQDYGTGGAPNNAFSAIAVGGTMINHLYEDSYGPNQEHGQTYMSSDTGPSMIGMVEPDVVAPAMFGYSPEPFQNTWVGRGDSYLWWSGTSLACPIAAGVAALIVEALYADGWTYNPMDIKNILLSSATDMGLDAMVQGHGIVNAEAAVTAIIDSDSTTEYIFYDTSSFDNWAAEMTSFDSWWIDYGYYWFDVWTANMTTPAAFSESSNIYFGAVAPGTKSEVNFTIEDYEFTRYDSSDMDTFQPWYYAMDAQYTFTATTDMYNDTSLPSGAGT
ncbi:MAG: S8 family serine peptidase, partial [Candidatus Thorarchaeota archaeon]